MARVVTFAEEEGRRRPLEGGGESGSKRPLMVTRSSPWDQLRAVVPQEGQAALRAALDEVARIQGALTSAQAVVDAAINYLGVPGDTPPADLVEAFGKAGAPTGPILRELLGDTEEEKDWDALWAQAHTLIRAGKAAQPRLEECVDHEALSAVVQARFPYVATTEGDTFAVYTAWVANVLDTLPPLGDEDPVVYLEEQKLVHSIIDQLVGPHLIQKEDGTYPSLYAIWEMNILPLLDAGRTAMEEAPAVSGEPEFTPSMVTELLRDLEVASDPFVKEPRDPHRSGTLTVSALRERAKLLREAAEEVLFVYRDYFGAGRPLPSAFWTWMRDAASVRTRLPSGVKFDTWVKDLEALSEPGWARSMALWRLGGAVVGAAPIETTAQRDAYATRLTTYRDAVDRWAKEWGMEPAKAWKTVEAVVAWSGGDEGALKEYTAARAAGEAIRAAYFPSKKEISTALYELKPLLEKWALAASPPYNDLSAAEKTTMAAFADVNDARRKLERLYVGGVPPMAAVAADYASVLDRLVGTTPHAAKDWSSLLSKALTTAAALKQEADLFRPLREAHFAGEITPSALLQDYITVASKLLAQPVPRSLKAGQLSSALAALPVGESIEKYITRANVALKSLEGIQGTPRDLTAKLGALLEGLAPAQDTELPEARYERAQAVIRQVNALPGGNATERVRRAHDDVKFVTAAIGEERPPGYIQWPTTKSVEAFKFAMGAVSWRAVVSKWAAPSADQTAELQQLIEWWNMLARQGMAHFHADVIARAYDELFAAAYYGAKDPAVAYIYLVGALEKIYPTRTK